MRKQATRRKRVRVKRDAPKPPPAREDAEKGGCAGNVTIAPGNPLELIHQLQAEALDPDLTKSEPAFQSLMQMLDELFVWLQTMAALHPMSLGALRRGLPEPDAWARYEHGQHVGAWAGVELARRYKQVKAEIRSRSKHSVNPLRNLRLGFRAGKFDLPGNCWFCDEYERRTDYRPTGRMAVWVARKIEEVRKVKVNRSQWRTYAAVNVVGGKLHLRSEAETEAVLSEVFSSDVVPGHKTLKMLDALPGFGESGQQGFEAWRQFIRNRLLTNPELFAEFDRLFPHERRKLDGVIAATLRSVWRAIHSGGNVVIP